MVHKVQNSSKRKCIGLIKLLPIPLTLTKSTGEKAILKCKAKKQGIWLAEPEFHIRFTAI